MEEHTDYIIYDRPNGQQVRVVFELYRYEILFHYCEYRHNESSPWLPMTTKDDAGYFHYTTNDTPGAPQAAHRVLFPSAEEIGAAQEDIAKKYNIISF